jgi:hypothetical protein
MTMPPRLARPEAGYRHPSWAAMHAHACAPITNACMHPVPPNITARASTLDHSSFFGRISRNATPGCSRNQDWTEGVFPDIRPAKYRPSPGEVMPLPLPSPAKRPPHAEYLLTQQHHRTSLHCCTGVGPPRPHCPPLPFPSKSARPHTTLHSQRQRTHKQPWPIVDEKGARTHHPAAAALRGATGSIL